LAHFDRAQFSHFVNSVLSIFYVVIVISSYFTLCQLVYMFIFCKCKTYCVSWSSFIIVVVWFMALLYFKRWMLLHQLFLLLRMRMCVLLVHIHDVFI